MEYLEYKVNYMRTTTYGYIASSSTSESIYTFLRSETMLKYICPLRLVNLTPLPNSLHSRQHLGDQLNERGYSLEEPE
jgi:hypothetical protein